MEDTINQNKKSKLEIVNYVSQIINQEYKKILINTMGLGS